MNLKIQMEPRELLKLEMLERLNKEEIDSLENLSVLLDQQYEHMLNGEIEWIGDHEIDDTEKDHDSDGNTLLYSLIARREKNEFKPMYYSYDKKALMQIDYTVRLSRKYMVNPIDTCISQVKENEIKKYLEMMEEIKN